MHEKIRTSSANNSVEFCAKDLSIDKISSKILNKRTSYVIVHGTVHISVERHRKNFPRIDFR